LQALKEEGIEVLLNERVTEVTSRHIVLQSGQNVTYGLCLWAAGAALRHVMMKEALHVVPDRKGEVVGGVLLFIVHYLSIWE
jgi:NADH dehydrogenase FAD-containing subunit